MKYLTLAGIVIVHFLSHLCGDEVDDLIRNRKPIFLSHLCGDEDYWYFEVAFWTFLSHLCGDEGSG